MLNPRVTRVGGTLCGEYAVDERGWLGVERVRFVRIYRELPRCTGVKPQGLNLWVIRVTRARTHTWHALARTDAARHVGRRVAGTTGLLARVRLEQRERRARGDGRRALPMLVPVQTPSVLSITPRERLVSPSGSWCHPGVTTHRRYCTMMPSSRDATPLPLSREREREERERRERERESESEREVGVTQRLLASPRGHHAPQVRHHDAIESRRHTAAALTLALLAPALARRARAFLPRRCHTHLHHAQGAYKSITQLMYPRSLPAWFLYNNPVVDSSVPIQTVPLNPLNRLVGVCLVVHTISKSPC